MAAARAGPSNRVALLGGSSARPAKSGERGKNPAKYRNKAENKDLKLGGGAVVASNLREAAQNIPGPRVNGEKPPGKCG